jgi:CHAD domain
LKARRVKKLDPAASLAENAARMVLVRLDEMCSFAPKAIDQRKVKAQHDMRIAAKRLRYVLEATEFCFGRSGQTARRRARDLQDVLGELHDCDVMLPRLREHLADLRSQDSRAIHARAGDAPDLDPRLVGLAPHRTAYRGLESLAVYFEARRELLFDRFREQWRRQEERGTWERLERAANRQLELARRRRRATRRAEQAREELAEAERRERKALERARRAAAELTDARGASGRPAGVPTPPPGSRQSGGA